MMDAGELYLLTFASGRQYIGITRQGARTRYRRHQIAAESGKTNVVYKAWRKYGAPTLQVLAILERDELPAAEARAVQVFRTRFPHGYNMAHGGMIAPTKARIVAEKISASKKGKPIPRATLEAAWAASRAKKWTAEERARLSASKMGRFVSAETRRKISQAQKGKPRPAAGIAKMAAALRGKKQSAETIAKRKAARAGHRNSLESYARGWQTRRVQALSRE